MAKLRDSYATQASANDLGNAVSKWLRDSDPTVLFRTCHTCTYGNREKNPVPVCHKFKLTPPVAVITGSTPCPSYHDAEDIPF